MIAIVIVSIVVLLLGLGLYKARKLQHIHVQKQVQIATDLTTVYNHVAYLENFTKWSPFYEADPTQITKVTGTDGQVGAQFHWEGNGGKDLGYQEITEIKKYNYIKMECDIEKPFKAHPTFEYTLEQQEDTIVLTQDFNLESGLAASFFMWLFGAKTDMDKMNGRGMELLKQTCEQ